MDGEDEKLDTLKGTEEQTREGGAVVALMRTVAARINCCYRAAFHRCCREKRPSGSAKPARPLRRCFIAWFNRGRGRDPAVARSHARAHTASPKHPRWRSLSSELSHGWRDARLHASTTRAYSKGADRPQGGIIAGGAAGAHPRAWTAICWSRRRRRKSRQRPRSSSADALGLAARRLVCASS